MKLKLKCTYVAVMMISAMRTGDTSQEFFKKPHNTSVFEWMNG